MTPVMIKPFIATPLTTKRSRRKAKCYLKWVPLVLDKEALEPVTGKPQMNNSHA